MLDTAFIRENLQAVKDDLEAAQREVMEGVEGPGRERLERALELALNMNPLTPDHHFYVDQGTNARLRIAVIAIGRKLVAEGALDDAEDVVYLRYHELRRLMADPGAFDARDLTSDRRDDREEAFAVRPPAWVGTATKTALAFPPAASSPGIALPGSRLRGGRRGPPLPNRTGDGAPRGLEAAGLGG